MINTGDDDADLFTGGNDDYVNTNLATYQNEQLYQPMNNMNLIKAHSSPVEMQKKSVLTPKPAESKSFFGKIKSIFTRK